MSKSIIEKLGITPGPWEKDYGQTMGHIKSVANEDRETPTVARYDSQYKSIIPDGERHKNAQLIAAAPEMLEALIKAIRGIENIRVFASNADLEGLYLSCCDIFQKATGRTWAEIKELL